MEHIFDWALLKSRAGIFVFIYLAVIVAVVMDLISGVRKAKQLNIARTSYGFRRTINKLNRYFGVLFSVSMIDCVCYLIDLWGQIHLLTAPYFTAVAAICLIAIEIRSIYEKAEDKYRKDLFAAGNLLAKIVNSRGKPEEMYTLIKRFMQAEEAKMKAGKIIDNITHEEARKEEEESNGKS